MRDVCIARYELSSTAGNASIKADLAGSGDVSALFEGWGLNAKVN